MKVFPPTRKEFKKPASRFAKTVRLLSNVYLLPLRFNEDYSAVKYTILHLKSLISFLVFTIPFYVVVIWYGFQLGFLQKYMGTKFMVYETIDIIIIFILLGQILFPYEYFNMILSCKSWITFPELSLDRQITFSKNIKSTITFIITFTGKYS